MANPYQEGERNIEKKLGNFVALVGLIIIIVANAPILQENLTFTINIIGSAFVIAGGLMHLRSHRP